MNYKKFRNVVIGCILILVVVGIGSYQPVKKTVTSPPPLPVTPSPTPKIGMIKEGLPPQIVVLSFDGSRSLNMWKSTLDFARSEEKIGVSIKFTYFISGVYLIPYAERMVYQAPEQATGESKIGFADNALDVKTRVELINQAAADGHEIASHLNGHFAGGKWTTYEWQTEFNTFAKFVDQAPGLQIKSEKIVGFRAPNLAFNDNLWPVLKTLGYRYEAGQPGKANQWPIKKDDVWRFILPGINLAGTKLYPLAMDYNFFVTQTNAVSTLKRNTPEWTKAFDQTAKSLMTYFNYNYKNNRAPVVFANHFSDWNDNLYWEAMKSFAAQVCNLPDVRCVSYRDLADFLDTQPKLTGEE